MKKSIASNIKISQALIAMIFSILFIFTAFYNPIEAHADGLVSDPNGASVNGQEVDSTSTANYLFWAASGDRTGIMIYIVDESGAVYKNKVVLVFNNRAGYNDAIEAGGTKLITPSVGHATSTITPIVTTAPEGYDSRPVYYADGIGWQPNGESIMSLLTSETTFDGKQVPFWFKYAATIAGADYQEVMNDIMESADRSGSDKWTVVIEPISCQYIYKDYSQCYTESGMDTLGHAYNAGNPKPYGTGSESSYSPNIYVGTCTALSNRQVTLGNPENGGDLTFKFLNMALPWGLCLAKSQEVTYYTGVDMGVYTVYNPPSPADGRRLTYTEISYKQGYGIAVAFIDVSYSRPPLHTFDGTNTPGNTEVPSEDNYTTGDCTIKKLYYTETLNADGSVDTSASPNYVYYNRAGTTSYISIDTEEGYEIVGWKTSNSNSALTTKSQFDAITGINTGYSAGIINLKTTSNREKYLYILYKKTEINPPPPAEYDFLIEESQITERVSFVNSDKTKELFTNIFSWYSEAHDPTTCQDHDGYGHNRWCTKEWDVPPVAAVEHTCTSSCSRACTKEWDEPPVAGVRHIHITADSLLCRPGCTKTVEERFSGGRKIEVQHVHQYLNQQ